MRLNFSTEDDRDRAFSLLNSTLFYWFYQVRTNCRDFNPTDFKSFPSPRLLKRTCVRQRSVYGFRSKAPAGTVLLLTALLERLATNSFMRRAKSTIDEVDCVLAGHYGFSSVELDFLINYDIKYRMGQDADD
ncbi:MAG: hypothetical protein IPK39_23825 [Sulfuritalea sp.]|nr:hypothetical protein [Sulfuritalea sp.]